MSSSKLISFFSLSLPFSIHSRFLYKRLISDGSSALKWCDSPSFSTVKMRNHHRIQVTRDQMNFGGLSGLSLPVSQHQAKPCNRNPQSIMYPPSHSYGTQINMHTPWWPQHQSKWPDPKLFSPTCTFNVVDNAKICIVQPRMTKWLNRLVYHFLFIPL